MRVKRENLIGEKITCKNFEEIDVAKRNRLAERFYCKSSLSIYSAKSALRLAILAKNDGMEQCRTCGSLLVKRNHK
jgi:hypothetical protein